MTKNKKIMLLANDNKKLMKENQRMHELSNESLSQKIIAEMERYTDITEKLYAKYKELDNLKIAGIKNRIKYRIMLITFMCRHIRSIHHIRDNKKSESLKRFY